MTTFKPINPGAGGYAVAHIEETIRGSLVIRMSRYAEGSQEYIFLSIRLIRVTYVIILFPFNGTRGVQATCGPPCLQGSYHNIPDR